MFKIVFQRAVSMGMAAVLTLGMLGGIDHLSQREEQPPQWAQQAAPRG